VCGSPGSDRLNTRANSFVVPLQSTAGPPNKAPKRLRFGPEGRTEIFAMARAMRSHDNGAGDGRIERLLLHILLALCWLGIGFLISLAF
jgi:hypothetical protein